jgi:hypothetical protein
MSNTIALYAPFSVLSRYQSVNLCLCPLATRSPTLLLGAYKIMSNPQLGFLFYVLGKHEPPDPLIRLSVPKRHNLRRIHQLQLVSSVSKIIMKILVCAAQLKAFSSYMIMVTRTSSCSKSPTRSSSCTPRPCPLSMPRPDLSQALETT